MQHQDIDTAFEKLFQRINSYRHNINFSTNRVYPSHLIENMYAIYAKHCRGEHITAPEQQLVEMLAYDDYAKIKDLAYINGEFHKCVSSKPKLIVLKHKSQHQA